MAALPGLTLSAALSVYNARDHVGCQLDSLLTQTRLPDEIVVGDAGSTDGTSDIVRDRMRRARDEGLEIQWRLLEPERLLVDGNMARIYAACSGDVVVICDDDDVCLPERFAHAAELFAARPDLLFMHADAHVIDGNGEVTSSSALRTAGVTQRELADYRAGEAFRVLVRRFLAHGATAAFRRDLLGRVPPVPPQLHHDAWYALLAAAMGALALDERTDVQYRTHGTNLSGGVRRRSRREKLGMLMSPGTSRNDRLLAKAEALVAGLEAVRPEVADWAYELALENLRHERARARFPANRVLRAPYVLREASTGAYGRTARGHKDVLLDLVQPRGTDGAVAAQPCGPGGAPNGTAGSPRSRHGGHDLGASPWRNPTISSESSGASGR